MSAAPSPLRRVQRVAEEWPIVHLEGEIPEVPERIAIDGLVRHSRSFTLADLRELDSSIITSDFHCVWGWSRCGVEWRGLELGTVLDVVGIEALETPHVTVFSASDTYSSSLPLADAARGVLAWKRDREELAPEHGGPLRFVSPPEFWAYKDVKWVARITVTDRFDPGFWESRVADPMGRIPHDLEERP